MIPGLRLVATRPNLRIAAIGILMIGTMAASLAPYQALVAIKVFGLPDRAFAMIFAAGSALSMVTSVYVGLATDQWASRRKVAILAAAISMAGFALVWGTGALWAYLLTALVANPVGFTLVGQFFAIARVSVAGQPGPERDAVMTLLRMMIAVPYVTVLPFWSLAFNSGVSLLRIYMVATLAMAVILLVVVLAMREDVGEGREVKTGLPLAAALRELATRRVALRLALMATLVAANTSYMMTLGVIFEAAHPEGEARTAQFAAIVAALEIPFMLAIPWFTARASKATVLLGAALIYSIFLLALPPLAAQPAVWLLTVPAAMGASALLTLPIAYFQDLLSDRPGAGSSLQSVNHVTSQLVASTVFWAGTAISGYGLVMALSAVLAVLAGIALRAADAR